MTNTTAKSTWSFAPGKPLAKIDISVRFVVVDMFIPMRKSLPDSFHLSRKKTALSSTLSSTRIRSDAAVSPSA